MILGVYWFKKHNDSIVNGLGRSGHSGVRPVCLCSSVAATTQFSGFIHEKMHLQLSGPTVRSLHCGIT